MRSTISSRLIPSLFGPICAAATLMWRAMVSVSFAVSVSPLIPHSDGRGKGRTWRVRRVDTGNPRRVRTGTSRSIKSQADPVGALIAEAERQRCFMRIIRNLSLRSLLSLAVVLVLVAPALAQQFNWQQAKGTQLRVLMNKHPWQGAIEPHLKDFEALTGIKLIAEVYPEDQFRAKVLVELTSGSSSIDVFMSMPAQEGLKYMRAGWLQPLDEMLKSPALTAPDYNWTDFLEKTREAMVIEGKLVGVPIQVENTSLMYRKDVFQKYNVKVPTTLDELEAAAKALNGKVMTDDGQTGYGLVARGKRAAATSQFAAYLHADGSTWLGPNREPVFNNEDGIKAFELYGRLLRLYGPPGSEKTMVRGVVDLLPGQGRDVHRRQFPVPGHRGRAEVESGRQGRLRAVPEGPQGPVRLDGGGMGLAMPKSSKNQKAAWLFMQWATAKDQVMAVQSEKGVLGARESVWKDPRQRQGARGPEGVPHRGLEGRHALWNPRWWPSRSAAMPSARPS